MIYDEHIYFQKIPPEDKKDVTYPVYDTIEEWEFYGQELEFEGVEAKEPYKNEWFDEDGDDEYVQEKLLLKSCEMKMKLAYKCEVKDKKTGYTPANRALNRLMDYLTGRDNTGTNLMVYSTWLGYGRQNVRFQKLSDKATLDRNGEHDVLIVELTFKVNDPVTRIIATKNGSSVTLSKEA